MNICSGVIKGRGKGIDPFGAYYIYIKLHIGYVIIIEKIINIIFLIYLNNTLKKYYR